MELIKIINARSVLESLSDRDDINTHLSYWMTKFIVKTENEQQFYAGEMRKLCDKYGEAREDGSLFIPAANIDTFNVLIDELSKTDVEDPGIRFNLSELSAELKLSMKQIYPLLDFIDEEK